ncbi:MAG: translation initiation factor IF-2 [Saprospiraceae bacterium]|nr:translation initiation factor IF-2 [Saprospiraceae bacterium]
MSKRLVKIAKELNVGTSTIVDFLTEKGYEIDNKPTSKVSDEMYADLLREFSKSMDIKEKADQLVIGTRPATKVEKPVETVSTVTETIEPEKEEPVKVEEPVVEKEEEEVITAKTDTPQLKVIGKIDLDKPKPKKKEEKKEEPKEEPKAEPEVVEEVKQEETPVKGEPAPEPKPVEEVVRAKTPQLQGLKIQGKIDIGKLKKPKKKTTEESKKEKGKQAPKEQPARRKRKRKKVNPSQFSNKRNQRGRKKEEVKEVTQKEIDEKIKQTMARLSGGGKNKRQKIRRDSREVKREKQELIDQEAVETKLKVTEFISVSELASLLNVPVSEVITTCMNMGVIVSINQRLDAEVIELLANEFGHEVEFINLEEEEEVEEEIVDDPEDLVPRAPIVTVMGHVDHGKTSLLDYIRETNVAGGEAGGITQHIGAYEVHVGEGEGKKITFLDTPGHEAFTAMRARGAKVTDIVIIIIAADDKIMPQTKEAISHSQAAGVPIVFAINKIDKPGADVDRIKQELASMNLLIEEWGGQYQSQDISAKTGQNIDQLMEKILLEAEVLELKANPDRQANGTVLEASLDKGRGYVTKVLVQSGTLEIGDSIVAGSHSGRIKAMFNERGKRLKKAGPSTPIVILGLGGAPQAGEKFKVVDSDQEARQIAAKRSQIEREQTTRASKRISLDEIGRRLALGTFKELNLIVKGDVDGSIEALSDSLIKLSIETVQVNVIHKAVGAIAESDVLLASASDAIIIGFQVRPSGGARNLAEKEGVQIRTYSIIYEAIEEIKMAIEGMLEPTKEENILGQVEVRETYKISKVGTVAGCYVQDGVIQRNAFIRLVRDGIVVYPNKEGAKAELSTLKRFKDDVKEVKAGMECGLTIKNYNDIKIGDVVEVYEIKEVKQTLS